MDAANRAGERFDLLLLSMAAVAAIVWLLIPQGSAPHLDLAGWVANVIWSIGT